MRAILAIGACLALVACGDTAAEEPSRGVADLPMRWDFHPRSEAWTEASLAALEAHGAPLATVVPEDIAMWCPAYPEGEKAQRDAFWTGLLSALAKHESTWNPQAVGGNDQWFGLVQISPATARG
ncbi:transglycosylase SLT domain-containing protein [Tropicimonas sp. S265A]|uniref:transglycosylase SLT domain-containing protein n=1 Tax=Tropicimonas sp. S265A TaxID=3415134 RepID=UPI003C79F9A1